LWDLASNTIFPHFRWSLTIACLFFIPTVFKPSSNLSLHLFYGLLPFLVSSIVAVAICFGIHWFCTLSI
jgi:hypothetical protein